MKFGAGAAFLSARTGRLLLNLRSPHKTHKLNWSLWGGMAENDETPAEALRREVQEEMGDVPIHRIYPFDVYESADRSFRYYTFVCVCPDEFSPILNAESAGYCWTDLGVWPKPLHQGVRGTLASKRGESLLRIILSQHQGATNLNK